MRKISYSYFVVLIDYGRKGVEATVDPEITRSEVIRRLKSGEYSNVLHIDHVCDGLVDDVTGELIDAAEALAREEEMA
jgi:hypothetical protein